MALAQGVGLDQYLGQIQPRELGPASMGGRISQFAVYEKEPRIFYVASASGGLWKTENAGLTMEPVFNKEAAVSLGAVAVSQDDPNLVWVGTGEENSRNSTTYGAGVFKSTDGGKTWEYMGLKETMQIARIVISPKNPDVVYVAALGHLWGPNEDRGVYKTEDAGKTWTKVLYENEKAGFISLEMDPKNPDVLLAASWERMRWPWKWASGGPSSSIYRTTDGGKNWKKSMKGIPESDTGRIGLSYFRKDPKVVVASVEKATVGSGADRKTDGGIYRSTDGGQSWTKVNDLNPRPFYFSCPIQDPVDENRIYLSAVQNYVSNDKGKTFETIRMPSIHVDNHAFWVDPSDNNHLLVGNDGGVGQSRDGGKTWEHMNYLRVGQFYAVSVDMRKPYWVYGGLQDNGSWAGPTQTSHGDVNLHDWYTFNGGDGFYTQNDPEDWTTVYSESQGGFLVRTDIKTGERRFIRPRPDKGGPPLRFNWDTPVLISPHNHEIIYVGSQFLHKSVDRGENWETISPDLTTNDPEKQDPHAGVSPEDTGAERHTTIVTISESPVQAGVIWVGTDDGNLQLTKDGGKTWTNLIEKVPGVPKNTWVSRVRASKYEVGRAYVTFDGHRNDDYKPYVFVTEDFGETWTDLTASLPDFGSTYVITEGERNPDLLTLGTEFGLFFSLNRGITWTKYATGDWPTVRVDDLVIHPRELDLVVGTHGRSIWIIPIAALEQLTTDNLAADAFVCQPQTMYLMGFIKSHGSNGDELWSSPNSQPDATIYYYIKEKTDAKVSIEITRANGEDVATLDGDGEAGLHKVRWFPNRRRPAVPGDYSVVLKVGDKEYHTSLAVEDLSKSNDPNVIIPDQR